ncbi:MAG TPA: hypothetical protein VL742_01845 [Casimicrobiaceae bacterium]|nr:hypothetical protein [Casimicrobiaceae bacterium]
MKFVSRLFAALPRRLFVALAVAALAHGAAGQAPAGMDTALKNMLSALQAGSVADFVAPGDDHFKAGMTQAMLDQVRAQLGPRLARGYTSTFLGSLREQGYTVLLWKLEFKDGNDDRLVTMAVKDGKVAGFFLR